MLESDLSKKARKYFDTLKPDLLAIKKDQGRYSQRGISDWILCYQGRTIFIELKVGDNKPTPLQSNFLREAREAGAIAVVCRSMDEIRHTIKEVEN